MYQQISAWDPLIPVLTPMFILAVVGGGILYAGERKKSNVITGIVCLALCLSILPFAPAAFEKAGQRQAAKENNILIKYMSKNGTQESLNRVDYDGDGGRSGGSYFKLTYVDHSTKRIKFLFNYDTGEPFCDCDLKEVESFATRPEFKELGKSLENR